MQIVLSARKFLVALFVAVGSLNAAVPSGFLDNPTLPGMCPAISPIPQPLDGSERKLIVMIHGWTATLSPVPCNSYFSSNPEEAQWHNLTVALTDWIDDEKAKNRNPPKLLQYHWEADASTGGIAWNFEAGLSQTFFNACDAADHGAANGSRLATLINSNAPNVREVTFVAHSAGTWVAKEALEALLRLNPYVVVNLVLLDPFIPETYPTFTPLNDIYIGFLSAYESHDPNRIYRLQNYFTRDDYLGGTDHSVPGYGSNHTSYSFNWPSARDTNQNVYWMDVDLGFSEYYRTHSDPIQFYADTVIAATPNKAAPTSISGNPNWNYTQLGFFQSLSYEGDGFELPRITAQPLSSLTVVEGSTATFTVAVSHAPEGYQWWYSSTENPNETQATRIIGATGASYSIDATTLDNTGYYVLGAKSSSGWIFSDKVYLKVNPAPVPPATPTRVVVVGTPTATPTVGPNDPPVCTILQTPGDGYVDVVVEATDPTGIYYVGAKLPNTSNWIYSGFVPESPLTTTYDYQLPRIFSSGWLFAFASDQDGNYPASVDGVYIWVDLAAPSLSSPLDASTGNSNTPNFTWSQVPGAGFYYLMVASDPSAFPADTHSLYCPACISAGFTNTTSYSWGTSFPIGSVNGQFPQAALSGGSQYYWKVEAFSGVQNGSSVQVSSYGRLSATSSFRVQYPTNTPTATYTPTPACITNYQLKWGSQGQGNGQFESPEGVAVDSVGNIYATDINNNRIQKFSPNGTFILKWGQLGTGNGQFDGPQGITIGISGTVYVTDTWNDRIEVFTSSGAFVSKWGATGNGDGQFNSPNGIATDAVGNVYVVDAGNNRVQVFSSSGSFITKWGGLGGGNGQFNFVSGCNLTGIAVDGSGRVFVSDSSNHRVQVFTSDGTYITQWGALGNGDGAFNTPQGLAVDDLGYILVADAGNSRVQRFTSAGAYLTQWDGSACGCGAFAFPMGIVVSSGGTVYVASFDSMLIEAFGCGALLPAQSNTITPTITGTPSLTLSTQSVSATLTVTPSVTMTITAPVTSEGSFTVSGTTSPTLSSTQILTVTVTPPEPLTPTISPTLNTSNTVTVQVSLSESGTPSNMFTLTETPAASASETPAGSETETPGGTETETPAESATETPAGSATKTPAVLPTVSPTQCHPVISMVAVRGAAGVSDEFIQIYNPCASCVDLSGWKLVKMSDACTTSGAGYLLLTSLSAGINSTSYLLTAYTGTGGYVLANYAAGSVPADIPWTAPANALGGNLAVGLVNDAGSMIDVFGFGSATCFEGSAFGGDFNGANNFAAVRIIAGLDTDNNQADFTFNGWISGSAIRGGGVCYIPTPVGTSTTSSTPMMTPTVTLTATATSSQTITVTCTGSATASPTSSPSSTPTSSETQSVTITNSPSGSMTRTVVASDSATESLTNSPTPTTTPTFGVSATASGSPTVTFTPAVTYTFSPTATNTMTVMDSATVTATQTSSPSATEAETPTLSASATIALSESPSETVSAPPSVSATDTPSRTPSSTSTDTPTAILSATSFFTASPSSSPTVKSSATPTTSPSPSAIFTVSATASTSLTVTRSATPDPGPTVTTTPNIMTSPTAANTVSLSGNGELSLLDVVVAPQPVKGSVIVWAYNAQGPAETVRVAVYTQAYQKVLEADHVGCGAAGWSRAVLSVPGLVPGIYFYRLCLMDKGRESKPVLGRVVVLP